MKAAEALWCLVALAGGICLAAGPVRAADEGAFRPVARVEAAGGAGLRYVVSGDRYTYSPAEVPASALAAGAPERTVLFGSPLELSFGVRPRAAYRVRATLLSDSPLRRLRVTAGHAVLEADLTLPFAQVVDREWPVPAEAIRTGTLELRIQALAGPNAVACRVEFLSDDLTPLAPPEPLERRLERVATPMVRLWPRPSRVAGVGRPVLPLDGPWRFSPNPPERFWALPPAAYKGWPVAPVPGEWTM